MKRFLILVTAMFLVIGVSGIANALTFTDTTLFTIYGTINENDLIDYGGDSVKDLESANDFVTWAHNFDLDPPATLINSGQLTLSLVDNEGDSEEVEYGFYFAEDFSSLSGEVSTGEVGPISLDVTYLYDGEFRVKLSSVFGDFSIISSNLTIDYDPVNPVPEPTTILLLGSGLLGLVGYNRKRFRKKS